MYHVVALMRRRAIIGCAEMAIASLTGPKTLTLGSSQPVISQVKNLSIIEAIANWIGEIDAHMGGNHLPALNNKASRMGLAA